MKIGYGVQPKFLPDGVTKIKIDTATWKYLLQYLNIFDNPACQ